ncbi:DSS1/SEM1 family-domain-containing protein [Absidia repens]|uniref:26S proteasome complex subunit SEM1 n=1 Tax=Absidia repens TaxID=90262 RepID=A0A1X2IW65_9FUNG|nr:DSS1/SEM1 family-domain-containing protein [Absidia repens]
MAAPSTQDQQQTQALAADTTNKNSGAQLGALEEDDEFEEFPAEDWAEEDEDKDDTHYWEDNWDDDDIEDDFSQQLKAELEKTSSSSTDTAMKM